MEKGSELELLQAECVRLRRSVGGLKATNTERSKKIVMLEGKLAELQQELFDNRRMLEEMSGQVAEYGRENEALRLELAKCKQKKRSFFERLWG